MSNVNNNKGDVVSEKCKEVIKPKPAQLYTRSPVAYHPNRKRAIYENSELFHKVKHQLNNYLEKMSHCKTSSICSKDNYLNLSRNSINHLNGHGKRFHRDIFNGTLPDTLNEKEKSLLKFLLMKEEIPPNKNIILTKSLQRHLHNCLMDITTKVGIKSGILDLITNCPVINEASSVDIECKDESEFCSMYVDILNIKLPNELQCIAKEGIKNRSELNWNASEMVRMIFEEKITDIVNVLLNYYCVINSGMSLENSVEILEKCLHKMNENSQTSEQEIWLKIQYVLMRNPLLNLNVEHMHYSLENFEKSDRCFWEQEIDFTYQPNYCNHLLHLYFGLKHQND